jgi:hypothetical protein
MGPQNSFNNQQQPRAISVNLPMQSSSQPGNMIERGQAELYQRQIRAVLEESKNQSSDRQKMRTIFGNIFFEHVSCLVNQ